jgi:NIPSNAP
MIYELRTYEAALGKLAALNARFRDHTMPLFTRHNMQVVGFWTYAHGGWSDQLVYLMAFENMADRDAKWAAFQSDPDWIKARDESQRDGTLTTRIRSDILRPTDYSPAQ